MELSEVTAHRIIPVAVIADASSADALARALVDGGLPLVEVTLRTPAAEDAIRTMARRGDVLVGAGTVRTPADVDLAVYAGASFLVSPGVRADVVRRAQARGVPVVPGCVTPTEVMAAEELGLSTVKFFPAGQYGGAATIAALSEPFHGMEFIPTGGVRLADLAGYLTLPCVSAVGGTWLCAPMSAPGGDLADVTALCAEAVSAVARIA